MSGVLVLPAFADERGVERRVQHGATPWFAAPSDPHSPGLSSHGDGPRICQWRAVVRPSVGNFYTEPGERADRDRPVPWARPTTVLQTASYCAQIMVLL